MFNLEGPLGLFAAILFFYRRERNPEGQLHLTQSQITVSSREASVFVLAGKGPFHAGVYEVWKTRWVLGKGKAQE